MGNWQSTSKPCQTRTKKNNCKTGPIPCEWLNEQCEWNVRDLRHVRTSLYKDVHWQDRTSYIAILSGIIAKRSSLDHLKTVSMKDFQSMPPHVLAQLVYVTSYKEVDRLDLKTVSALNRMILSFPPTEDVKQWQTHLEKLKNEIYASDSPHTSESSVHLLKDVVSKKYPCASHPSSDERAEVETGNNEIKDWCTPAGISQLQVSKVLSDIQKNSASDSIMIEGILRTKKVFVKLTFAVRSPEAEKDNSLAVERYLYQLMHEMRKCTPNVVALEALGECKNFDPKTWQQGKSGIKAIGDAVMRMKAAHESMGSTKYDFDHAHFLVTRAAEGEQLSNYLSDNWEYLSDREQEQLVLDVLFQIAYLMLVFKDLGLMHNDLHLGNVFIKSLGAEPRYLTFGLQQSLAVGRNIRFFVSVFDFDYGAKADTSYCPKIMENTKLNQDQCPKTGRCSNFRENADWYKFLFGMGGGAPVDGHANPIIIEMLKSKLLQELDPTLKANSGKRSGWYGQACLCTDEACRPCEQIPIGDAEIQSPLQFLQTHGERIACEPEFRVPSLTTSSA